MALTSALVQIIPTFDNLARRASSNTPRTPASVVARPILQIANTSSHLRRYRSVIFSLAESRSRSPVNSVRATSESGEDTLGDETYQAGPPGSSLCSECGL